MTPPDETLDRTALAVVVARLDDMREDFAGLRRSVEASASEKVSRGEWGQRNQHVDSRLAGLGREIGDLRAQLQAKSAPWWSVLAVVIAGAGFAWSVLGPAITSG
jgi:hypothetical protein